MGLRGHGGAVVSNVSSQQEISKLIFGVSMNGDREFVFNHGSFPNSCPKGSEMGRSPPAEGEALEWIKLNS